MELLDSLDEQAEGVAADRLTLAIDGWEGPLDLLLALARTQKVDLAKISILALVEQYLAFIADAKKLRLEIAADYLVMAAWLAYLKSCLLLPRPVELEPDPDTLALRLQLRLRRLNAMRDAAVRLLARDRIGSEIFVRGAPEGLVAGRSAKLEIELYALISAYGRVRARAEPQVHVVGLRPVMTLDDALARLERMLGSSLDWMRLEAFLPETQDVSFRRSALASSFAAALELARQGKVKLGQEVTLGPLWVRAR